VVCAIDLKGIFQYVSPSCQNLFGYSHQEMTGSSFLDYIHPDDVTSTIQAVREKKEASTSNFENRYYHKNGSVIPLIWSGKWDEADGLLYCVARDASDKKEMEHRLLNAQQLAKIANYEFDLDKGIFTHVSDTLLQIFGIDKKLQSNFTPELFWNCIHPEDKETAKKSLLSPDDTSSNEIEYRLIQPDGKLAYIYQLREVIRDKKGKPVKTIGIAQDITERKLSQLQLQQSEERFRSLVQNGNDMIGIIDATGTYLWVGSNVQEHLGYTEEDMIGKNALSFIHPDDVENVGVSLQHILEADHITVGPFRYLHGNGEWRWIETHLSNHLKNPVINGLIVNSKDVTEKKRNDDEIAMGEERFKSLMQHGSDLIVTIDAAANFTYISSNVINLLGYEVEEMLGQNALSYTHPEDLQKAIVELARILENAHSPEGIQHRFLNKKGEWVWLESRGTNHFGNPSINGILINSRNIDDRIKLQERLNKELLNKQKEITSAVIKAQETERSQLGLELHDNVNQVLTTVKLYNEMYLTGYVQDKELLVKSTQYTQDCINEIRSISKRLSAPTLGKITLQESIRELIDSINLTKRVNISYNPVNIDNLPILEDLHLAIYRIVQESLNNIIKYSQAQTAIIQIELANDELILNIKDDGKGFDTTVRPAGIGITNMRTRAESLNGRFSIKSSPGHGCQVTIHFPWLK
jgi:PAS domain S-box-containing protein